MRRIIYLVKETRLVDCALCNVEYAEYGGFVHDSNITTVVRVIVRVRTAIGAH